MADSRLLGTWPSSAGSLVITELVRQLNHPWSAAWVPIDAGQQRNAVLISERNGGVWLLWQERLYPLQGLPQDVYQRGQGGYLGLYYTAQRVYLSYSQAQGAGQSTLVLVSFGIRQRRLEDRADSGTASSSPYAFETVGLRREFRAQPPVRSAKHFGGTITGGSGWLYLSLGERGRRTEAQNSLSDWGSIVRLRTAGGAAVIFSIGHRNPQGLAYDPRTQQLWSTEHGPQGGDELNRIEQDKNYGWPIITYGAEYGSGAPIGEGTHKPGLEQPFRYWNPSLAPGGLLIVGSRGANLFPQWQGDFLIPMLRGERLLRLRLSTAERSGSPRGQKVLAAEELLQGPSPHTLAPLGRLRWVGQGPDGALYLLTDKADGQFLRLTPE